MSIPALFVRHVIWVFKRVFCVVAFPCSKDQFSPPQCRSAFCTHSLYLTCAIITSCKVNSTTLFLPPLGCQKIKPCRRTKTCTLAWVKPTRFTTTCTDPLNQGSVCPLRTTAKQWVDLTHQQQATASQVSLRPVLQALHQVPTLRCPTRRCPTLRVPTHRGLTSTGRDSQASLTTPLVSGTATSAHSLILWFFLFSNHCVLIVYSQLFYNFLCTCSLFKPVFLRLLLFRPWRKPWLPCWWASNLLW